MANRSLKLFGVVLAFSTPLFAQSATTPSAQITPAAGTNASDCELRLGDLGVLAAKGGTDPAPYEALVSACPTAAEAHYALGVTYRKLGRKDDARREFTRALEIRDLGSYRIALAVVTFELGDVDTASQLFARAAELEPRSIPAHQGRAWVAAQRGDISEALEILDRALALDPNNGALLFNRAALRERKQQLKDAASDYERVTTLDPAQVVAWCRLGMLRFVLGNSDAAVVALSQCTERGAKVDFGADTESKSQVIDGGVFLSRALGETGELERAELTLRRMVEKNPTDPALKIALAEIYLRMKRFGDAMTDAKAATALDSKLPRAWAALGQAALGLGDNGVAEEALSKARSLGGPADPALANNLGVLQLRLGRTAEAKGLFEEALKIDRQFEPAQKNLEKIK